MYACIDGWKDAWMVDDGWVNACKDGWMGAFMDRQIKCRECMHVCLCDDWWTDEWMHVSVCMQTWIHRFTCK